MSTTNIRIPLPVHQMLMKLAKEQETSMQAVLKAAIEEYRRKQLLLEANQAYAALQKDQNAWTEMMKERELLEGTIADGLPPL